MNLDVIRSLKAEEKELAGKLRAIRSVLDIYAPSPQVNPAIAQMAQTFSEDAVRAAGPLTRSEYGQRIRDIAREVLASANGTIVPTRDIVVEVEAQGIDIRGQSPLNAVSALLSRSNSFINVERQGWRLAENASPDDDPDEEIGAPEGAPNAEEAATSSNDEQIAIKSLLA